MLIKLEENSLEIVGLAVAELYAIMVEILKIFFSTLKRL